MAKEQEDFKFVPAKGADDINEMIPSYLDNEQIYIFLNQKRKDEAHKMSIQKIILNQQDENDDGKFCPPFLGSDSDLYPAPDYGGVIFTVKRAKSNTELKKNYWST